jgi:3-methyladenine DNA glycosylase AlkD
MARYGISTERALGISNAALRPIGKVLGRDHERARALWATGNREARLLGIFTEKPEEVTRAQADAMAAGFDSWEIDHAAYLFCVAGLAHEIIPAYAADEREFVRRAALSTIVTACVHLKKEPDHTFLGWLDLIEAHATDGRNFVRKAVNWALRQTGKRSVTLHTPAHGLAQKLAASPDRTARWTGADAVRELSAPRTLERLEARGR